MLFTAENARAYALKSHAPESARFKHLRSATVPEPEPQQPLSFNQQRLVRVRMQLIKLDKMIAEEDDPQKLDRLASASMRVSEQARILEGQPLPGSLRPQKPSARQHIQAPLQPTSAPLPIDNSVPDQSDPCI
jgi:hypothetical protein